MLLRLAQMYCKGGRNDGQHDQIDQVAGKGFQADGKIPFASGVQCTPQIDVQAEMMQ